MPMSAADASPHHPGNNGHGNKNPGCERASDPWTVSAIVEPSMPDRRPRYPIRLPLLYAPRGHSPIPGAGWTWNLGELGACVELAEVIPPRLPLDLFLHTGQGALLVETHIAWTEDTLPLKGLGSGILHGVTFARMTPIHQQQLRDLLLAQYGERRIGVRFAVDVPFQSQSPGVDASQVFCGRISNISHNGLLIRLAQSLSPGTVLHVTLQPPTGPITVTGEILWVDPAYRQTFGDPVRHGFRFFPADWTGRLTLARFVAELTSASTSPNAVRSSLVPIDCRPTQRRKHYLRLIPSQFSLG